MDKTKQKILIASIAVIVALIAGILIYMGVSGKFKSEEETSEKITDVAIDGSEGREKTPLPASPVAVFYNSDNSDELKAISTFGFNTVIFDYTQKNEQMLSSFFTVCRDSGICFGCRVPSEEKDSFIDFYDDANPDFVIFSGLSDGGEYFVSDIMDLRNRISTVDPYCLVGTEADDAAVMSDYIQAASGAKYIDFVLLSQKYYGAEEFGAYLEQWSEISSDIWINFNTSSMDSMTADDASHIISLMNSADTLKYTLFSFSDYSSLKSSSSAGAQAIKEFIRGKLSELEDKKFEITNYSETDITVTSPVINFKGTCSPVTELKCNGSVITKADNGDFSVDCKLKAGQNNVTFENNGNTYEYHVLYQVTVIKSVSPSSEMIIPGNMEIELYATALTGSTVSAVFNGKTYSMTESEEDSDDEESGDSDFTTYSVTVKTPAGTSSQQDLGSFKVNATYDGISESKTGAAIKVSKKEIVRTASSVSTTVKTTTQTTAVTETSDDESESSETSKTRRYESQKASREAAKNASKTTETTQETTAQQGLQKYSYASNYGLGTAKYVEIIDDYVETYPGNNLKVYSVPDCSPLLRGTVDYYEGSATIDSDTYYILTSGYKVPAVRTDNLISGKTKITQAKVVEGYIMPSNNVKIISSTTENNKTVIKLSMNYKVPVNAKLTGQSYSEYTSGRLVKVSSVNCTGLQFTFGSTASISGSLGFSGSLIASATTSKDTDSCSLNLKFATAGKFYGFHTEYDSEGNLVITISQKPSSISGYTIMIDPGHGGRDGGSVCSVSSSSWDEAAINLSIAQKIREELQAAGATVIMTRDDDSFVSLTRRNEMVRQYNPDLFISVHCDSSSSSTPYGTTAFYYRAYSQPLAKCIHSRIVSAYSNSIYAGKGRSNIDRGTNFGAYKVTRVEECPAVLIEYGFVSEITECQALQSSTGRNALAKATAEGIKDYIAGY